MNSGLVFTFEIHSEEQRGGGLNPFEFRAGIYLESEQRVLAGMRLNPFEFRAGIYLARRGPSSFRVELDLKNTM